MLMNSYLTRFLTDNFNAFTVGQLPRVSGEDPERIRVDSVVETFVCSLFFVIKFSNFSLFHPSLIIQYSTEECSTVQYKAAGPVRAVISIRYGSKERKIR